MEPRLTGAQDLAGDAPAPGELPIAAGPPPCCPSNIPKPSFPSLCYVWNGCRVGTKISALQQLPRVGARPLRASVSLAAKHGAK